VEAEASTAREVQVGFVLEVDLQSKLSEAPFVVGATGDPALLCLDRPSSTLHVIVYGKNVQVVVI
jgi:hypothetical protein